MGLFGQLNKYKIQRTCTNAKKKKTCRTKIKSYVRKQGAYPPKRGRMAKPKGRRRARRRSSRKSIPRGDEYRIMQAPATGGGFLMYG